MKLTITKVSSPKEIETARGPATKVSIKTAEYGDLWLSGFPGSTQFTVGQIVDLDVKQNGDFMNYRVPKPVVGTATVPSESAKVLQAILETLNRIEKILANPNKLHIADSEMEPDEDFIQ